MTRLTRFGSVCLAVAVAVTGCGGAGPVTTPPIAGAGSHVPNGPWETIDPAAAGYQAPRLDRVTRHLEGIGTTAFVAVIAGRIVYSYGDLDSLSYLASARKSVLSMLYGKPVVAGTIDLDRTLADLGIDDRQRLTPKEREATIADLLGARSGVFHPASNPGDLLDSAPPRGSVRHGTYQLYSNWDFNALGTIFEQLTGRDLYDALAEDLAGPIGMEDFRRDLQVKSGDTTRSRHLAYHMVLSTRDMARLGLLMLRQGRWGDRQVVPREWVARSTTAVTPSFEMNPVSVRSGKLGYGFLWWTLEEPPESPLAGAYAARGAFGQYILVVPRLDLVVVHKKAPERAGDGIGWLPFRRAVDLLLEARAGR